MPVRVLVVDDEVSSHELVAEYMRGRGWEVDVARDGREGRALLASSAYDLLITDLKLPDCDGLELLRSASRRLPSVPGVVMTGYASVEVVVEALRMKAYDFVLKPIRLKTLFAVAESAMRRAGHERESSALMKSLDFYETAALAQDAEAAEGLPEHLVTILLLLEGVRYVALWREGLPMVQFGNADAELQEWPLPGDRVLVVCPPDARVGPLVAAATQALQRCGS